MSPLPRRHRLRIGPKPQLSLPGLRLKLVQRPIRDIPIVHPRHPDPDLLPAGIYTLAGDVGHRTAVPILGDRVDLSLDPIAEVGKRLAGAGAVGLLLFGGVDLGQPDLHRLLVVEDGQGVAVGYADDRG